MTLGTVIRAARRTVLLLGLVSWSLPAQSQPRPELFNHGRTRSFRGGSETADGRQLFLTVRGPDRNTAGAFRDHIATTRYENGRWTDAAPFKFFDHATSERDPVISPNGRRLYFSSTAAASGATEQTGWRVWYVERTSDGWSAPVYADSLNVRLETSVTSIAADGTLYLAAGDTGVFSFDLYRARTSTSGFTTPVPTTEWNSAASDVWVAVDPAQEFAVVVRSPSVDSAIMMVSVRDGESGWSAPRPLSFDGANWLRPYDYRFPFVGGDRSSLWITSASRLFRLPTRELLTRQQSIAWTRRLPAMPRPPVPALVPTEPELFHPVDLRTTNGITFTPNDSTLYLSQFTDRRDPRGRRSIRIFESQRAPSGWSVPAPVSFGEPSDPSLLEEYHPVLSPDGRTLYFNSRRQADGSIGQSNDLWRIRRDAQGGGWGPKEPVREAVTPYFDDYASPVRDGSVYFRSERPGGAGAGEIYVMKADGGRLEPPELVTALNSAANENDLSVDPDQRLVVFNRYFPETRDIDLFVSVRGADGAWRTPRALSAVNTVVDWELTPTLSRDGNYLYVEVSGAIVRWRLDALLTEAERRLLGR